MRAAKVAIRVVGLVVGLLTAAGAVVPVYAAGPKHGGGGPNRSEVEGRKHARKANQLADVNKCKAAIPEYTKAIHLLKDPTLLFNRGECYRRTGDAKKAIADYRKFLTQLPSAPNRALVESQIAALENNKGAPAPVAAAPAISPPVAHVAPPKPAPEPPPAPPPPPIELPPPPPLAEEHPAAPPLVPEREPELAPSLRATPPPPVPAEAPGPMAIVSTKPAASQAAGTQSGSSYWWIWVLGAVVVVGAGAGAYFALKQGGTDVPSSGLGNYRF
jgi:hypothetical protein